MFRMPFLIAAVVMLAGLAWTIQLVVSPDPWAADAALAIAIGTLTLSIATMTGLLLSRGRWTRYFAGGLVVAELAIALVAELGPWLIAAVVLSGLALAGLGGPWLDGWLRQRPAAGSPGLEPLVLAIGAFAVVPMVGIAAPAGLEPAHGWAGALGILFSWGYIKGGPWALWGLRLAMPLALILAAVASPLWGAILLTGTGGVLGYLAWTAAARLAVDPLPTNLPAPRARRT